MENEKKALFNIGWTLKVSIWAVVILAMLVESGVKEPSGSEKYAAGAILGLFLISEIAVIIPGPHKHFGDEEED